MNPLHADACKDMLQHFYIYQWWIQYIRILDHQYYMQKNNLIWNFSLKLIISLKSYYHSQKPPFEP